MRIDAYTHFFPKKFFDTVLMVDGEYKDMGKRVRAIPALYDLDIRKKIVDGHKDYAQILSYPMAPVESFAKSPAKLDELIRMINDGFAELCAKERDRFPGWVAQVSLDLPDAGAAEADRAINQLGALGVQVNTNIIGKPLDRPQYLPFWKKMNELGKPVWLHPARGANMPDYIDEKKSLYEIWWTFGWSYETATAMARLVFSKIMDNHPNLKIITHHFGGIVPMLEGSHRPGLGRARLTHNRRGLRLAAQEPEEAPARLFQAGFLC
jgi:aminocarboxymuconate-semialdehyde decarboxylase